jgi:spore coat polysaccharide biosynthesis protein SpsF
MKTNRVFCFIQCRSGSTRFPKKCFAKLGDQTLIERVINICKGVLPNVVVLIPFNDYELEEHLLDLNAPYFKGSPSDVLSRYVRAASAYDATHIVRVTADCPVLDHAKLYYTVHKTLQGGFDFASNAAPHARTTADGDDVEVLSRRALDWADNYAVTPAQREHVTQVFYDCAKEFRLQGFTAAIVHSHIKQAHIKTSIDTPEDLERVREMLV